MRVFTLLSVTLLSVAPAAIAQEKPAPPNEPPHLWRATASEQDGTVVVQIARPEYEVPRKPVAAEAMKWQNLRKVTLGQTVHAFGVDGKRLEPKAVLKALTEPKGVAVFVRYYRPLADPDPFYLAMLREGTIVLVVDGGDVFDLKP
jgi:hypothetical protein